MHNKITSAIAGVVALALVGFGAVSGANAEDVPVTEPVVAEAPLVEAPAAEPAPAPEPEKVAAPEPEKAAPAPAKEDKPLPVKEEAPVKKAETVKVATAEVGVIGTLSPATAVANSPNFWNDKFEHPATCYKHEAGDNSNHGTYTNGGKTYVLAPFQPSWGDHWESIIVKAGTQNAVTKHPTAGVEYAAPDYKDISHVIVCKGHVPEEPEVKTATASASVKTVADCNVDGTIQFAIEGARWENDTDITDGSRTAIALEGYAFAGGATTLEVKYTIPKALESQSTNPNAPCFVPPTNQICDTYSDGGTSTNKNANGWVSDDTRATGHAEYVEGGLHVYTEGATSTDKVNWYKLGLNTPLRNAGYIDTDYTTNFGIAPGIHLVVEFQYGARGTLVQEDAYGQDLWLTNGSDSSVKANAPVNGGGNGSQWHGTIDQWLTKYPDAKITGIGFSGGSGVYFDGVIHSITAGCVVYSFDAEFTPLPADDRETRWVDTVDCITELVTSTEEERTRSYTRGEDGEPVAGEWSEWTATGETAVREASDEELTEEECPLPEPPAPLIVTSEWSDLKCGETTQTRTVTTTTYAYVGRELVATTDVKTETREVEPTDCPTPTPDPTNTPTPTDTTDDKPLSSLAVTGVEGLIGSIIAAVLLLAAGLAMIVRRRTSAV